uniref:LRRCT domain-containing protein n=1 Tax=Meloidogyne hapla TaxID=6305 RepID=A0A1I8BH72_MELHA
MNSLIYIIFLFFQLNKIKCREQQQRERKLLHLGAENDPNVQYQCKGALGDYAACLCNNEAKEVACINAQFVDTAIFQYMLGHYNDIEQLTFHGNNFQDLPDGSLFGTATLENLRVLNISANYIVNLHRNALSGCPNIEILDLSNNELYLRRAFTTPLNRSGQFNLLIRLLEKAQLKRLEVLDLSYNYFNNIPLNLPCSLPSLRNLDLRNYFHSLDSEFQTFGDNLHKNNALTQLQLKNNFYCDCNSNIWIKWIREHSNMIDDYRALICSRSSPAKFTGTRLSEIPIGLLDCQTDLYVTGGELKYNFGFFNIFILFLIKFIYQKIFSLSSI